MSNEQFDNLYYTIANESGGIQGLLRSMFSFLFRRTDFFYECNPGDNMGFPPGVNQQIVFKVFEEFRTEHYKKFPKQSIEEYQQLLKKYQEKQQQTTQANAIVDKPNSNAQEVTAPSSIPQQPQLQEIQNTAAEPATSQVESETTTIKKPQTQEPIDINTYNGGKNEKYIWSQSITDVTVQFDVPQGTSKKDLDIQIQQNHLKLKLKNEASPRADGELYDIIDTEDSTWSIEQGTKVIFVLWKARENIWKSVIKGDVEIDATKVDNSKPLDDFDPETQGALRKIMYEQQRKQMGLPTTQEEKQLEMLQKAWDAEGSPFKGQPFDPSQLNLPTPDILGNMN